jgi:hypothetical protein
MQVFRSTHGRQELRRLQSCRITHLICFIWHLHRMLWMEKTFSKFHGGPDSFLWCETSRLKWALVQVKMTFSWIGWTKWVHKVVCEILTIWLESGPTPCMVIARNQQYTSTNRAKMADVCKTTTIWLEDGRELRSTLGWEWTLCKHYLGKSSRNLKPTQKGFRSSVLEKL